MIIEESFFKLIMTIRYKTEGNKNKKNQLCDSFYKLLHVFFIGSVTFPPPPPLHHRLNRRLYRQWVKSICPTVSRSLWTLSTNEDVLEGSLLG